MAIRDDYRKEFEKLGARRVRELLALGQFNENKAPQARVWLAEEDSADEKRLGRLMFWFGVPYKAIILIAAIIAIVAGVITLME